MVYMEDVVKKYPIQKNPNLSRASSLGILGEQVISGICKKGKAVQKEIKNRGKPSSYYFGRFRNLDYFPKYDIYLYTSSSAPWSFGNTFYAKTEKAYRKFWNEVVRPVTKELWK